MEKFDKHLWLFDNKIFRMEFEDFLQLQALQMTEIYEYAMSLSKTTSLPSFQSLKFIYATWLLDHGLTQQAFAYFEKIATEVIKGKCYFLSKFLKFSTKKTFFGQKIIFELYHSIDKK